MQGTDFEREAAWWYNQLTEHYTRRTAGRVWAGEFSREGPGDELLNNSTGPAAIRYAALIVASDEISRRIHDNGDNAIRAFNRVTSDWPHAAATHLAGFEAQRERSDVLNAYQRDVENFAEVEGTNDPEPETIELDHEYGPDPYRNLPPSDADIVMAARVNGFDEAELDFDEISNVDGLIDWMHKSETLDEALRVHRFSANLPRHVLRNCADPSDWEATELNPDDVQERTCVECAESFYHIVEQDSGDPTWVNYRGDPYPETADLSPESDDPHFRIEMEEDSFVLCGSCIARWQRDTRMQASLITPRGIFRFRGGRGTYCADSNTDLEMSDLTDDEMDMLERYNNGTDGLMQVDLQPEVLPVHIQERFISNVAGGGYGGDEITDYVTGPVLFVAFTRGGSNYEVTTDATNYESVHSAKTLLENANSHV